MKSIKDNFSEYFKRSVLYLIKSKILFFIFLSFECIEISTNITYDVSVLFQFNNTFNYKDNKLSTIILTISPYHYFFNFMKKHISEDYAINGIVLVIIVFIYILFFVYFFNSTKTEEETENNNLQYYDILQKFCINFFDYILYRAMPLYSLDICTREIIMLAVKQDYKATDLVLLFFSSIFLLFVSFFHIIYYLEICTWSNFNVIDSCLKEYPYDQFFSAKFDIVFFFLKMLITFNLNYIIFHDDHIDFIVIFISFIIIITFLAFVIFTFTIIFYSESVMYFHLSFYNKLRIFYVLFIFESVLFRLILNANTDHIPFIIYLIICFVLNCYIIVIGFESLVLQRVIINQNYLGVCWFIQGNDIDIQHFIAEWITYHKTLCILDHCLICKEIGNKEKNYFGDYCLNDTKTNSKTNFGRAQTIVAKKKQGIKKNLSEDNVNLINKIFPPYKFSQILLKMAERRKKFMDHDELIRFDFLHIMVLFLSEVSIEFHLFNELSKLIWKYSENRNVYVSLILVYDIIKKNNLEIIKGYDVIKKNEELRNNLSVYIKTYENFIKYGDKSPLNYIEISGEFHKFKEIVKDIHILFKKNIECNYQLLLMRYAYESLLHLQFKNMQPFDLNYYSDFLDFHFLNDKIILMKYFIEYDYFLIIKGSKELLKYQGKLFSKIFPPLFESIAISKFKEQLINQEQKEKKALFEFFTKSMSLNLNTNLGFIESIKMKYIIYPTNSINELFIQANYISNYNNLMIFEEVGNEHILLTFSPQLYKIIGLTPDMILSLKKTMNFITFKNLFNFKNNYENSRNNLSTINSISSSNIFYTNPHHHNHNQNREHDDNLFNFQYKAYYPYYCSLVANLIRDNFNYSQVKEKVAEISNLAKEQKELSFLIFRKFDMNIGNNKYIIYTLKEHRKRMKGEKSMGREHSELNKLGDLSGSRTEEYTNGDDQDDSEFNDQFEGKGKNLVASTLSLASFSGSEMSTGSSLQKGRKEVKNDEKNKRAEELKRYTIIILISSLFLIMICILFLILGVNQNKNFQELFNLFDKFKKFKRGAESSSLSIVSNYKYYSTKNPNGTNMFEKYSNSVANVDPILKEVPIYKLIQTEIKMKYAKIMNDFYEYKKEMFILGSEVSEHISSISGYSYSLIDDSDGSLHFVKKKTDLIDLIRQYNNIIVKFLQNEAYINDLFSIVDIGEKRNGLSYLYFHNKKEVISADVKDMILLILMFPFIHEGLKQTSYLIEELFDSSLKTIEDYLIIFYIILLLFHALLLIICIIFLISYIKMLKINIFTSNRLFNDKKFLDMQNKRIEQIKIMNNLYSEHPIKIAEKIDIIDELYRKKTKEENATNKTTHKTIASAETGSINGDDPSITGDLKSKISDEISKDTLSKMTSQKKGDISPDKTYLALDSIKPTKTNKSITDMKNGGNKPGANNEQLNQTNSFENIVNKNIKLSDKVFRAVINKEIYILYFTFGFYYLFNIIFFILVYNEKNKMNNLIEYCKINNSIDGYLFDNINAITYLYVTNSTSKFYSTLSSEVNEEFDYVQRGINSLYDLIIQKDSMEKKYNNIFPRLNQVVNLNCSINIIEDAYFIKALVEEFNKKENDFQDYGRALCKLFPVASTGSDSNIMLEILYNCEILYQKYKPNKDFDEIINLYVQEDKLFGLYTIILTLNRLIRTYFNDNIFIEEVNGIFDSFTYLFIIYLILSVLLEVIIFFILNFGVISDVRKTNKLLGDFMSSLKF